MYIIDFLFVYELYIIYINTHTYIEFIFQGFFGFSKNPETPIQKNLCTPMVIAVQFTITKCWKQPKCPSVNEWIKKLWYIYIMEYDAAEKKRNSYPS